MIPVNLRLSGFLSYHDPVELDFSTFDLACISGSNGAGKSSLLDAITWVLFGQARRRDDALINSHASAAEVIFDFRYEGSLFRVQRSKPREKSTVLEFYICGEDGQWRPLTEKSMRETEARIQSTLRMDYDTFTNASFLLQGRADQFAQQRPGDRKRVLSAILGLEVWEQYRISAADRRRAVELELKSVDGQLEEIDAELAQETERKQRLAQVEARLEQLNQQRKDREEALRLMQQLAARLEDQGRLVEMLARAAREVSQRSDALRDQLSGLCQEREHYQQTLAREEAVKEMHRRWQEAKAQLERFDAAAANFREMDARRSGPLTAITHEASRLDDERRALATQDVALAQQQARLSQLDAQRAQLSEQITRLQAEVSGRAALETELQNLNEQAAQARVENTSLKEAMNALKLRIDRLKEAEGADCPLCGQPLSLPERAALIAALEMEGKEMGDRYRANQERVSASAASLRELQGRIAALGRADEELRQQERQLDRLEGERQRIHEAAEAWAAGGAARLVEVTRMLAEEDFAHEARDALAVIDAELQALGYAAAEHDALRRAEQAGRASEGALRELEAARAALAPLERQIAGLEAQSAAEQERAAEQEQVYHAARERYEAEAAHQPDLVKAEREVLEMQSEENRLRMEVGMVRQLVNVLDSQRARRKRLAERRESLSMQIARLKTLERAFSKDGVPALLIEQALPEIETQANEILDRLSGGAMSVRFETQRQYKDKSRDDRRETLDIIISDASGEREYELFSGGEAFRVNFAIRLALSRVLAQRAGARLQTLVIDEGFGSQDAQGRQRLIEAINLVRPEFAKILVITHLEELKEAFPARIEVEKTLHGSRVSVVS